MNQIYRVLAELKKGPAMADDISMATGISEANVRAHLSLLKKDGLCYVFRKIYRGKGGGSGNAWSVWKLT